MNKTWFRVFICVLLIHFSFSSLHDEDPKYKYSKEANTKVAGSHGHSHGHHGHSHDHHGHSHDHHEHSHDHHGHSHDHHGHSHDHHGHSHDNHHGHSHDHHEDVKASQWFGNDEIQSAKSSAIPTGYWVWVEALTSTALISVAPIFILFFVPLDNTAAHEPLLKVLLSFASGGLLGDAFLHLIPHAIDPHDSSPSKSKSDSHDHGHSHEHDHSAHMHVGLWIVAGIMTFLLVEKIIRYYKVHPHSHGHSHGSSDDESKSQPSSKDSGDKKGTPKDKDSQVRKRTKSDDKAVSSSSKMDSPAVGDEVQPQDIKVAGYLNLAADFAHNFTDGLAIGASFLIGQSVGIVTTVTIFFHEIPHEIGDFAILVQSGCSRRKAMLLQFTTAIGAVLGTIVSLSAGTSVQYSSATNWILPFTAGGFIYIATVSVIPELLQDTKPWQSFKEIVALLLGVFMMVLIAQYE